MSPVRISWPVSGSRTDTAWTPLTMIGDDEVTVGQDDDLIADRELVRPRHEDGASWFPAGATVRRPREPDVAAEREAVQRVEARLVAREAAAVPDGVDVVGIERVGGDRLLVVERKRVGFADQRRQRAPRVAAVGRLADGYGVVKVEAAVEVDRDLVRIAVRRERHPGV